ncbi:phage major capsid protein [Helicobacter bizzozeronii]|uniref:phage major capsid protein n=1 Tax=Helicobacter bizzozeronii TaxID=56877 RepID=UPI0013151C14|nr:phage major capsid protein [Helicobacter bizzozeronii]
MECQTLNFEMSLAGGVDDNAKTLSFLAISKDPKIKQFEVDWEKLQIKHYYLEVISDNLDFQATHFYKDHKLSFDSVIGNIVEHKQDGSGHKVKVQFFSEISDSLEAYNKYKNGLSQSVSVGIINPVIENTKETFEGLPLKRMTKGEVIELSAVWRGADEKAILAQFAKKLQQGEMMNETPNDLNAPAVSVPSAPVMPSAPSVGLSELQNQIAQMQAKEANNAQILALGAAMGREKEALEAIKENKSYQDFSFSLISSQHLAQKPLEKSEANPVYSLANYAMNVASGNASRPVELSSGINGLSIDDAYMTRFDAMTSINSSGFVPNIYRADKFIQQVFQESNLLNLCDKMTGLMGVVEIPRESGKITAYWVDEGASTTESKLGADKITLTPKTIKAKVRVTRQMLNMTPLALESLIIKRMKMEIKALLELGVLYGKADANCPFKGVFATNGVNWVNDFLSAPNFANTMKFESFLTGQNLNLDSVVFVANNQSRATLKTSRYDNTGRSDRYLLNENGDNLCGYKFIMNNRVRNYQGVFGDFSNVILGTWNNLEVQALKNDEGDVVFTGFYDVAIGIKDAKRLVVTKRNADVI